MIQTRLVVPTLSALGLAVLVAACSSSSGGITPSSAVAPGSETSTPNAIVAEPSYKSITLKDHPEWHFRFGYVSNPNGHSRLNPDGTCSSLQLSVPNWTSSFQDGSSTYCYQMIGVSPKSTAGSTTLTTQVYALKLTFSDGTIFDPTAINPSCDSVSPYTRMIDSPLYNAVPIVNGRVKLGTIQYEDAQSVGEWWDFLKADKGYALNLQDTGTPVVFNISVPSGVGHTEKISGFCNGVVGLVDVNWLATKITTIVEAKWQLTQIPIVLLWDVFQTSSDFLYGGYHSYYQNGQNQYGVYSVITMSNADALSVKGIRDVSIASHELGETINDPSVGNTVPSWGHIGQQPYCQNNLEVGDPLTGTDYNGGRGIELNGFRYHPQELVYFNWFTQQTKYAKYGANHVYSMSGTLKTPAALCTS